MGVKRAGTSYRAFCRKQDFKSQQHASVASLSTGLPYGFESPMRIFSAVRHSLDPQFYYGGLWSGNFYPALRELGHEILESCVDLLPLSRFMHVPANFTREELDARADVTQKILEEVQAVH